MVEVVFVPVAFVQAIFVKKDGDVEETKRLLTERFVKDPFVDVTPVKEALVEVRFVIVPFVANEFVEVTLVAAMFPAVRVVIVPDVEFKFVTVPFVMVPLLAVRAEMKLLAAFIVVPEAILKPNHCVEVPLTKVRFAKFAFVP